MCLIFILFSLNSWSQGLSPQSDFWQKVRYGGGLGLGFGSNTFNASIAPSAIYQATGHFGAGLGLSFNYAKFRESRFTAYGASLLTLFNPIAVIQLSAEWEQLRVNRKLDTALGIVEDNYWSPALFLGAGYGNRNFVAGIRYDVLYDAGKSIYSNAWMPFIRVYF
jgi:hypothetical protein